MTVWLDVGQVEGQRVNDRVIHPQIINKKDETSASQQCCKDTKEGKDYATKNADVTIATEGCYLVNEWIPGTNDYTTKMDKVMKEQNEEG